MKNDNAKVMIGARDIIAQRWGNQLLVGSLFRFQPRKTLLDRIEIDDLPKSRHHFVKALVGSLLEPIKALFRSLLKPIQALLKRIQTG